MFKRSFAALAAFSVAGLLSSAAGAAIYNDTVGDNFDGNAHMDITSVEVTNTATDITFKINLNGDIAATNWGKYLVGIDTNGGTGDVGNPVGNPWGRNIRMSAGMDAFIGSWVDSGGGAQPWTYAGGSWTQNGQYGPALAQFSTTITVPLASLNLSLNQTINFDVYSSGGNGGDSANDAAGNLAQSTNGWSGPYDSGQNVLSYTIAIPEPVSMASIATIGGLALIRRRR